MKRWMAVAVIVIGAGRCVAQDAMAEALRKGIVQEETQQNLAGAIQNYQAVMERFDEARKTAATALLRMAECYRKQGNAPQAAIAYSRILRDFADQTKVAEEARRHTPGTEPPSTSAARARYREALEGKVRIAEQQVHDAERQVQLGAANTADLAEFRGALLQAQRQVAGFDAGLLGPSQPAAGRGAAIAEARRRYRGLLEAEVQIVSNLIEWRKKEVQLVGRDAGSVLNLESRMLNLQSELAAFDAGGR